MKKILTQLATGTLMLLAGTAPLRAELYDGRLPLYQTFDGTSGEIFNFQYADFKLPLFLNEFLARSTAQPWLKVIKTREALQTLFAQAWTAKHAYWNPSEIPPVPTLPDIDFEHYQLVMGGLGNRCYINGPDESPDIGILNIELHDVRFLGENHKDDYYLLIWVYRGKFSNTTECLRNPELGSYSPYIAVLMTKTDAPIKISEYEASFKAIN